MRRAFIEALADLADRDERIVLLTGDLGFSVIEPFADRHRTRFVNVGVAEQNMVGVATGLAEAGFIPFTYSIATFATLRPLEFIRNGPVLHRLPVRVVGVGGGFEYGSAGFTHHALDDFGCLRSLPGLVVLAPADTAQARSALMATWERPEPIYFRLGKNEDTLVPGLNGAFEFGRLTRLRHGRDVAIIATGAIANEAARAGSLLAGSASVYVAATISPAPVDDLVAVLRSYPLLVTVEAHSETGGLGSLVAEVAASRGLGTRVIGCAIPPTIGFRSGSESFLNSTAALTAEGIARRVTEALEQAA
jgi:transketolase